MHRFFFSPLNWLKSRAISLLLVCFLLGFASHSDAQEESSVSDLLREVEARKSLVLREISQLDHSTDGESDRVIRVMDSLFANKITDLLEDHYQAAEEVVNRTELPEHITKTEIVFAR